jgi:hypothetical protein
MSEGTQEPKLYPAWRQALNDLELAGIEPGQTIEKSWLEQRFGITPPVTIADAEKNSALFRSLMWQLKTNLLRKHRMMLRAVSGVGYRVVEPEDQTATALRDRGDEVRHALAKLMDEVSYVRTDRLDDASRKANSDAVAKVGAMMSLTKKRLGFDE